MLMDYSWEVFSENGEGCGWELTTAIFSFHPCFAFMKLRKDCLRIPDDIPPFPIEDVGFVNAREEFTRLIDLDVATENATIPPVESLWISLGEPLEVCDTGYERFNVHSKKPGESVIVLDVIEAIIKNVSKVFENRTSEDDDAFSPRLYEAVLEEEDREKHYKLHTFRTDWDRNICVYSFNGRQLFKRKSWLNTGMHIGGPPTVNRVIYARAVFVFDLDCDDDYYMNGDTSVKANLW